MQDENASPARETQSSPADGFEKWWSNFVWSSDSTPEQLTHLAWQASASQAAARIAELEKRLVQFTNQMGHDVNNLMIEQAECAAMREALGCVTHLATTGKCQIFRELEICQKALSGTAGKELLEERAALLEERDRLREAVMVAVVMLWHSHQEDCEKRFSQDDLGAFVAGTIHLSKKARVEDIYADALRVHHGDKNDAAAGKSSSSPQILGGGGSGGGQR